MNLFSGSQVNVPKRIPTQERLAFPAIRSTSKRSKLIEQCEQDPSDNCLLYFRRSEGD